MNRRTFPQSPRKRGRAITIELPSLFGCCAVTIVSSKLGNKNTLEGAQSKIYL